MPYTPPSGGAANLEISGAYTPPAGGAATLDIGASGFSGQTTYAQNHALTLGAPAPTTKVTHSVGALGITIGTPAVTYAQYVVSSVAGASILTLGVPPVSTSYAMPADAGATLLIGAPPPVSFLGVSTLLDPTSPLGLATPAPSTSLVTVAPTAAALTLGAPTPTSRAFLTSLPGPAGLTLVSPAPTDKQVIHAAVSSGYLSPAATELDAPGLLALTAPAVSQVHTLRASIATVYSAIALLRVSVSIPYTSRVVGSRGAPYSVRGRVARSVDVGYVMEEVSVTSVSASVRAPYAANRVSSSVRGAYRMPPSIRVRHTVSSLYSCRGAVRKQASLPYGMFDKVSHSVSAPSDIKSYNKVSAGFVGVYSALGVSQVISVDQQPYITVGGVNVAIEAGDVSTSEGGFAWECNLTVAKMEDYARFQRDTPFTVTLYGEVYEFITDGKELRRDNPAQVEARIMGISPSARFASPRSPAADYLWDTEKYAASMVQEATGNGVTWGLIDWPLPAYRVSFTRATPMDIVKKLAEVAGGVVESSKAGDLRVRPAFPVSVPAYSATAPAQVFLEATDILSVSESYAYDRIYNKYRLLDVDSATEDSLEWEQGTSGPYVGVVRAYPFPWRTEVSLKHTGDPAIVIGAQAYAEQEHEEVVEFFEGVGNTNNPILALVEVRWTATNLGGLVYATDSRELTVTGPQQNSVAVIKYKSRSLEYPVVSPSSDPAQFLLESTVL